MKIFFGKISPKIEPKQLSEGYYRSEKGSSWFNGIDVGDYCFMIGANKIQLWKAKEWTIKKERSVGVKSEAPNEILKFDILIDDLKIDTAKLTSFIYLKLSMHLIIFSVRSAGSSQKAFFPLQISPKLTEEMLINVETYKNSNNYRKTWIFPTKDKLKNDSEDIQLYLENNEWKIQEPSFVDGHPFEDFKDNSTFIGQGQKRKDTTLQFVGNKLNWEKPISANGLSLLNIYDAFCCSYKQKEENDDEVDLNYWVVGATWGEGKSKQDKADDFIRDGEWVNGFESNDEDQHAQKTVKKVFEIKEGDWIAIKVMWSNIGLTVKAVGKVIQNLNDGRHLKVDWKHKGPAFNLKSVHYMQTVHQVTDEDDIKLIFHNSFINAEKEVVPMPAINNQEDEKIMSSKNVILFGPPGTGKTHELMKLQNKYIGRKEKAEDRLKEFISTLSWWEVIAVTLADIGKAASVAELQEHKFIKEKVSQSKLDRARPSNVLWSNLQSHASEDSKTVNVAKKHGVLIFDKTNDAKWHLVDNWKDQINDLAIEFELYKKGQYKASSNDKRFAMVTFHQSYSYEDFVEGIRPKLDGDSTEIEYEIKKGIFREICELAENHPDEEFAIFIDEINRGNISKIFGELITLIETDKRISASDPSKGIRVKLPYSRIDFGVPENLYIIGTMNSVDRSVALVDMALRRRFEFQSVRPKVEKVDEKGNIKEVDLKKIFLNLNNKITVLLGNEYVIGHSYFMNENVNDLKTFKRTWFNKILPLLQEYFFDDWKKIKALVKDFVKEESINGLEDLSLPFDGKLYSFKSIEVEEKDFVTMLKGLE